MHLHSSRFWLLALCLSLGLALAGCGSSDSPTSPTPPGPTPTPTPGPIGSATLVGAGDIARCDIPGGAEATSRLLDAIGGTVMAVGDLAYMNGTEQEFRECYGPTWGRHRSRTRPIPGNHDYETPGASAYYAYFGTSAGRAGEGYYSYVLGAWLVIALNSNVPTSSGSPQYEWLRAELAANTRRCVAAYVHHPLYSSSENGPSAHVRPLWQLLYDAGAELVVSGHDHVYERFSPLDPNGRVDLTRGVRQFVAGTGGAPLYRFVRSQPGTEVQLAAWGVVRFTLADGRYDWEFVPVAGESARDRGSDVCH